MPRDSYYQSTENPVQHGRLPATRPLTAFVSRNGNTEFFWCFVLTVVVALLLAQVAAHFWESAVDGRTPQWCYWILAAFPVAAWFLPDSTSRKVIWHLAFSTFACLFFPANRLMLELLAPALVSDFGIRYARHWTDASTCSPVARDTQRKLKLFARLASTMQEELDRQK